MLDYQPFLFSFVFIDVVILVFMDIIPYKLNPKKLSFLINEVFYIWAFKLYLFQSIGLPLNHL